MGLETALIATAIIGTTASVVSSERARKQTRAAQRAQQRITSRENQRARQQQLRESQRAAAAVTAGAAAGGALDTSAFKGGVSSIQTQAANNIGFINQVDSAQKEINARLEKAGQAQGTAAAVGAFTSLAGNVLTNLPAQQPSTPTTGQG
jgi:hypothetical protein